MCAASENVRARNNPSAFIYFVSHSLTHKLECMPLYTCPHTLKVIFTNLQCNKRHVRFLSRQLQDIKNRLLLKLCLLLGQPCCCHTREPRLCMHPSAPEVVVAVVAYNNRIRPEHDIVEHVRRVTRGPTRHERRETSS